MATGLEILDAPEHHAVGGKWEAIPANFPGCEFFLHEDDVTSGDTTWTDRVNGTVASASGLVLNKDATGLTSSRGLLTLSAPPITNLGSRDVFLLVTGVFVAASNVLSLGDSLNGQGMNVGGGGASSAWSYFDQYITNALVGLTYPTRAMGTLQQNSADSAIAGGSSADGGYAVNVGGALFGTLNDKTFTDFTAAVTLHSVGQSKRTSMIAAFIFTDNPLTTDELAEVLRFSSAHPTWLHPMLAGRT